MVKYIFCIVSCVLLSACGKKGPVESLEKSDFPRTYPKTFESRFPPDDNQLRP